MTVIYNLFLRPRCKHWTGTQWNWSSSQSLLTTHPDLFFSIPCLCQACLFYKHEIIILTEQWCAANLIDTQSLSDNKLSTFNSVAIPIR